MKQEHVILRALGPTSDLEDLFLGPTARTATVAKGIAVETEMLTTAGVAAVSNRRDVIAHAPIMPLRLVEPLDTGVAEPAAPGVDWGVSAVGAPESPFDGQGIVVAVLDTGIDAGHAAFQGVELVTKNFTQEADADLHGHGTHCAGSVFGRDVNGVRIGVARGVQKALIGKVLAADGGGTDGIADAIEWALREGANIISMSLGMDFPGYQKQLVDELGMPEEVATSAALEGYRLNITFFEKLAATVAAQAPFRQPAVILAAAGNESRTDEDPDFKIAVAPPAVSGGIISVAALGRSAAGLVPAPFSNVGALVSGPGVAITSAKRGGGLVTMSGTSMATPITAGVAALWAQKLNADGNLKPRTLEARVLASGTTTDLAPGFEPGDVGAGLVRAPQV